MLVALAVAVASIGLLALSALRERRVLQKAHWGHDIARIRELRSSHSDERLGPLRVVGLGASQLGRATYVDARMDAVAQQEGVQFRYVQIARVGGRFDDWAPLMARVREARPDIVVIEDRLLFWQHAPDDLALVGEHCEDMLRRIRNGHSPVVSVRQAAGMARGFARDRRVQYREITPSELQEVRKIRLRRLGASLREGGKESLEALRSDGVVVILLSMPVDALVRRGPDAASLYRELDSQIDSLVDAGLVVRLDCPLAFKRSDFRDLRHMMPQGRDRYSRWLIHELDRMAKAKP